MINLTLAEFLKQLASDSATPGGGSTAALTGALGCALVEMTNNLTIGKEAYRDAETEMRNGLSSAVQLRTGFTELINEDIEAFKQLMAKYKLPKQSEEEKEIRQAEIEKALEKAANTPLQIARRSLELLKIAEVSVEKGNKNVVSDAISGAVLAFAALQIGVLNVKVNVDLLKDSMVAAELEGEAKNLLQAGKKVLEGIIKKSSLSAMLENEKTNCFKKNNLKEKGDEKK